MRPRPSPRPMRSTDTDDGDDNEETEAIAREHARVIRNDVHGGCELDAHGVRDVHT